MRYTIEGFSQEKAVSLGLSAEDLVILRWFVDYWPSQKMIKMVHEGKEYALVNYKGFIEQMPIIGCNKRTIARKFQRLVESAVLENVTIRQGGSYSVYRFGNNYESLVDRSATGDTNERTVDEKYATGLYKNEQLGMYESGHTNTNSFNSTNQLNTHSFNTDRGQAQNRTKFTPPNVSDVRAYCLERGNNVDPERFVDYYTSNGWMVGKNHMKDWKASVRTWEKKDGKSNAANQRRELDADELAAIQRMMEEE